jgi:coenzyme F420-reducing hydrogenase delta subunit
LLEAIGLEGRRLQMINVSAAMGGQFAWSAAELTEEIRRMGSSPLKRNGTEE